MIDCYYELNTSDEFFTIYDEETGEYFTVPNPNYQMGDDEETNRVY